MEARRCDGSDFAAMLERAIERSGKGREIKQIEAAPMGDAEFTDPKSRRASTAQRLFANFLENPSVWADRPDGLERINVVRYASASHVAG